MTHAVNMTVSDAEGQVMEVLWRRSPLGTDEIAQALEGQQSWQLATSPRVVTHDGDPACIEVQSRDGAHTFAVYFAPKLLAAQAAPDAATDARKPSATETAGQGQRAL